MRIYDEHPDLYGPSSGWWHVNNPPGKYGLNHHGPYAYTYGNQDATATNWARWHFSVPDNSIYDVWVWVPANHATAQVYYGLHLGGCTHRLGVYPVVDQQNYTGWVKIGRVALDRIPNSPSNNVFLEALDNHVGDPNESRAYRSIGISVALLELDFNMGWEHQENSNQLITDDGCWGSSTPTPTVDLSEPRNVRAAGGDGSLSVSWDAPTSTAGLIDYDVEYRCPSTSPWTEWNPQEVSTRRSATITGLANGVACDIRVWAHSAGQNPQSGGYAYASGTPQGTPGPPGRVRGLSASGMTVTWSPPANNGGSPITGYGVAYSDGTTGGSIHPNNIGTRTSYTLPAGLSGRVRVTVTAHNAAGGGPGATITVNLATVDLSEPRNVRAAGGDGSLSVSWDAPVRTEGLIDYDVAYRCPSTSPWTEWNPREVSTRRSATITGLANGVACDIRVWAHSAGQNPQSGGYAYATATPQARSGGSVHLSVGGDARGGGRCSSVHCKWLNVQLTGSGWNRNDSYRVQCGHNGVPEANASAQVWRTRTVRFSDGRNASACWFGYPNRQVYVIVNGIKSNTVTWPRGHGETSPGTATPPGTPENLSVNAGIRTLTASWSPPESDGGSPITGYKVSWGTTWFFGYSERGSATVTGTSHTISGLTSSTIYTVKVTATNRHGQGPAATGTGTPQGPPSVPKYLSVETRDRALFATWGPPESDGGSPITGYRVSWSGGSHDGSTTVTSPFYTIRRLSNNTTYNVTVAAINRHGRGNPASEIETTRRTTFKDSNGNDIPLPQTDDVSVAFPNYRWDSYSNLKREEGRYWTQQGSTCRLGCRSNFATTTLSGRSVYWHLGHVQGVFTFSYNSAADVHHNRWPLPGRVRWRVYEKRIGDTKFRLVQTFTPSSTDGRASWWTYRNALIELDGEVRIRATGRDAGKRIAVKDVKLNHVDILPEHKLTAQLMCVDGQIDQQNVREVFTTLGKVAFNQALNYLEDLAQAQLNPAEYAKEQLQEIMELELDKIISDKNANEALRKRAKTLRTGLKAAGKAVKLVELAAEGTELLLEYNKALPEALKRLSTAAHRQKIKDNQCASFHARWLWQGYSKFDDDIAERAANGRAYITSDEVCYPEFRKYRESPKEACYWAAR